MFPFFNFGDFHLALLNSVAIWYCLIPSCAHISDYRSVTVTKRGVRCNRDDNFLIILAIIIDSRGILTYMIVQYKTWSVFRRLYTILKSCCQGKNGSLLIHPSFSQVQIAPTEQPFAISGDICHLRQYNTRYLFLHSYQIAAPICFCPFDPNIVAGS